MPKALKITLWVVVGIIVIWGGYKLYKKYTAPAPLPIPASSSTVQVGQNAPI